MTQVIPKSRSRKVNGYVKADEAVDDFVKGHCSQLLPHLSLGTEKRQVLRKIRVAHERLATRFRIIVAFDS